MTAWGVVAVCTVGGGAAGPLLDVAARRVRRPIPQPRDVVASPSAPTDDPPAAVALASVMTDIAPADAVLADAPADADPAGVAVGAGFATTERGAVVEGVAAGVVTGALCLLAAVRLGAVPQLAAYCVLFCALTAVSIVDLRVGLVPRKFVYPALVLVSAALFGASASEHAWRPLLDAAIGGAIGFLVFAAIWWIYPRGMGFGDVRLAGLCGAGLGWLGYRQLYLGFLAGFVLGALMGLVVLAVRRTRRFPFAPAMAAGTVFGVLWGGWLGNLWLHPG